MKILTVFLVITLISIAAFVAINWGTLISPANLSLGITAIHAPYGFVILGLLTLLASSFLAFIIYQRTSEFFSKLHNAKKGSNKQELTDNVTASNIIAMQEQLGVKLKNQTDLYSNLTSAMLSRLEQLDDILRSTTTELGQGCKTSRESTQSRKQEKRT